MWNLYPINNKTPLPTETITENRRKTNLTWGRRRDLMGQAAEEVLGKREIRNKTKKFNMVQMELTP